MRNGGGPNITLERIICEGVELPCLNVGAPYDRPVSISGGTSCPSTPMNDGSTDTVYDHTIQNVTIRNVFARQASGFPSRFGLSVGNVRNMDAQNIFVANYNHATALPNNGLITQGDTVAHGQCGIEPGNNRVRGLIVVNPTSPCMNFTGNGYNPNAITVENFVCHSTGTAVVFNTYSPSTNLETNQHPTTTLRNGVFNDCSGPLSGQNGARLTHSHNDVFNCGSLSGTGNQTIDPQFVGPETVAIPTLDASYRGHGQALWDWSGRYQPIIAQFQTQQVSFVDAGIGTASPCAGTGCDIGADEFFIIEIPPEVWASCAVYGNGDDVFGPFTNPGSTDGLAS